MMNVHLDVESSYDFNDFDVPCLFSFDGPEGQVRGCGADAPVPRGPAKTLAGRIAALVLKPGDLVGGALPFSKEEADCLWQVSPMRQVGNAQVTGHLPLGEYALTPEPWAEDYAAMVEQALHYLAAQSPTGEALKKIVLARTLRVEAPHPIPIDRLLSRLKGDPATTAFRVRLPDHPDETPWSGRCLVGATPELLLKKTGRTISSHPLAGSARRMADPARDRTITENLMRSEKDLREHRYVVEYILDTLTPYCAALGAPRGTEVTHTETMWHLGTEIKGQLRDADIPSVLLASILHPTPAICGVPVDRSARLIAQLEPVKRDFYAGAVGWSDARGDGAWYVAIRCADICGPHARLFAGAGIVLGSDPVAEAAETGAKFGALLSALGIPADAAIARLG